MAQKAKQDSPDNSNLSINACSLALPKHVSRPIQAQIEFLSRRESAGVQKRNQAMMHGSSRERGCAREPGLPPGRALRDGVVV